MPDPDFQNPNVALEDQTQQAQWRRELEQERQKIREQKRKEQKAEMVGKAAGRVAKTAVSAVATPAVGAIAGKAAETAAKFFWKSPWWFKALSIILSFIMATWPFWLTFLLALIAFYYLETLIEASGLRQLYEMILNLVS